MRGRRAHPRPRGAGGPLLVALTAMDDERTAARVAASGFDLHFIKPVDPDVLLRALGGHLTRLRAL